MVYSIEESSIFSISYKGTSNNSILLPQPGLFPSYCACLTAKAGYQNTRLAMLNSLSRRQAGVFGALYLKKISALVFQKELIEVPLSPTKPKSRYPHFTRDNWIKSIILFYP